MEEKCSARQLRVSAFGALLAPASALPGALARGGALGWLAPVLTAPLVLLLIWRLGALGGDGMAAALVRRWGRLGRALLPLYYLWALALAALTAGRCVDRLRRTDYLDAPNWLLALALTAVTAYLIYKGPGAFLRAAEIFFLALVAALALFFALGAANLRGDNLAPTGLGDAAGALEGVIPTAATAAVGTLAAFLPHRPERTGTGGSWRWGLAWCLSAAGLCLLVIGALGAPLTARAPLPFFLALQGLGFPGGFQRLEALGTAVWVLSDLVLLGLAALAARTIAGDRAWAGTPALAAALLGGCFLSDARAGGAEAALLWVGLVLGILLPLLLSLASGDKGKQGEGLSCGQNE